jgi:hypothetical protein
MVHSILNNQALLIETSLQTSGDWKTIICYEAGCCDVFNECVLDSP